MSSPTISPLTPEQRAIAAFLVKLSPDDLDYLHCLVQIGRENMRTRLKKPRLSDDEHAKILGCSLLAMGVE